MSVKKKFWDNPYQTSLTTKIKEVYKDTVTLDETIFYAFSGGQDSDSGYIGEYNVIKAEKRGLDIVYTITKSHSLKSGDIVEIRIEWEKRYRLMKLHFAAELILELVYQNYNHPEKIGANITESKARLDFQWDGKISDIFPDLTQKLKTIINADLSIKSEYEDMELQKRFWEIEKFAKVACGGTHIKKTGEIGSFRLKRENIGKGKERIEVYLV